MNKVMVEETVLKLADGLLMSSTQERYKFDRQIRKACDSDSKRYLLDDLHTLAQILKDNDCEYLVDRIFFYDDDVAQKLNEILGR